MTQSYDIIGIGNAIMDVIAPMPESFLSEYGIPKGGMSLIDEARALQLTEAMSQGSPTEIAGGSGANTIVGAAMLGAKTAYIGVVADDDMGQRFASSLRANGVDYTTPAQTDGLSTARCLIAVTPDGERSMNTFLGASTQFRASQLDDAAIAASKIVYLEGYLFDSDAAKDAFVRAAEIARAAGNKVALTLSDSFCVDRHRISFAHLIEHHIDILFANEAEITSLYETDFDSAAQRLAGYGVLAALTRSEKGSVIIHGDQRYVIDAVPVENLVDTTGAGDQYAAGFLAAYARGDALELCGKWGSACASEVIQHYGARPEGKVTL